MIVSYRRSKRSVKEYGGNEDFAWKFDSSAIVIKVQIVSYCRCSLAFNYFKQVVAEGEVITESEVCDLCCHKYCK